MDHRLELLGVALDGQHDGPLLDAVAVAATAGMICRLSGRLKRIVKVPSGRSLTGSPCRVTRALGSVRAVDDQFGIEVEEELAVLPGEKAPEPKLVTAASPSAGEGVPPRVASVSGCWRSGSKPPDMA